MSKPKDTDDAQGNMPRRMFEHLIDIPQAVPKKAYSMVMNAGFPKYWDPKKIKTLHGNSVALSLECSNENYRSIKILHVLNRWHMLAAFALFVVIAVWKYDSDDSFITSNRLVILNLAVGGIIGVIYLVFGTLFVVRIVGTFQGKQSAWDHRRRRVCILAGIDLAAGVVALGCFLASNSVSLVNGCGWFLGQVRVLTVIRSLAFGVILANQAVLGLVAMPVQLLLKITTTLRMRWIIKKLDSFENIMHGIDLPLWIYVCLFSIVLAPFLILVVFIALTLTGPLGGNYCTSIYDTRCYPGADLNTDCHQWEYTCDLPSTARGLAIGLAVYALVVLLSYFATLMYTLIFLKTLPYELYRTNHTELGFQLQTRSYTTILFFFSVLVLWMIDNASCNSAVMLLLGYLPIEMCTSHLVWTSIAVRLPHYLTEEEYQAMKWDQSFVWQEKHVEEAEEIKPEGSQKATFCFESALKAFYYSYLVYDIEEVPDSPFSIDMALQLHSLTNYKLLWHKELDAKCILAWCEKSKTIVIAFRGTASKKNILSDIKVWRSNHPPSRGHYWLRTMPLIHSGFDEFWYKSGLHDDVLQNLDEIMSADGMNKAGDPSGPGQWRISCYGHSLGGAAAKLATLDIQNHFESQYAKDAFNVSCITFGCPYVGNKAFAREYLDKVTSSWDIFHPNDAVSTSGKMFFMYSRCSQICLVSRFGDLILNPSKLERATLHRFHTKSVTEHLLSTYAKSFNSIIDKYLAIDDETVTAGLEELLQVNEPIKSLVGLIRKISS